MTSQFQSVPTSTAMFDGQTPSEWLSPSAALERFRAPLELLAADCQVEQERSRYGFQVGQLNFLIKTGSGSEVVQHAAIFSLPGSPSHLLGLINLRGNLVPVFDLCTALGLPKNPQSNNIVLVLDKGEQAVGIVIDEFPQPLLALRQVSRMPTLPANLQEHVSLAYFKDSRIWLDFNHQAFFELLSAHK